MKRIFYMLCLIGLTACIPLKPTPIPTPPALFGSAATAVTIEPDWYVESWRDDQILIYHDYISQLNIPPTFGRLFEISSNTYTPLEINDSYGFFHHAILSINPNQIYYSINDQIRRYDLQSQQIEYLTTGDEIVESSNGDFICVSREMTEIWIIDLVSGTEEKILTIPHSLTDQGRYVYELGLSPDEQWLIIEVVTIGGEEQDIYRLRK
ncbi:MAG TPA: hypothetical protein PKG95_12135 [Anaerolineaceae bacterium]|nr:hypothetical protein [Anaerolineaceae bacterium]